MTMVLQIIDLLYIKYKSQESIVIYISNHWMETTREGMSILQESGGCVICTLQRNVVAGVVSNLKLLPPKITLNNFLDHYDDFKKEKIMNKHTSVNVGRDCQCIFAYNAFNTFDGDRIL